MQKNTLPRDANTPFDSLNRLIDLLFPARLCKCVEFSRRFTNAGSCFVGPRRSLASSGEDRERKNSRRAVLLCLAIAGASAVPTAAMADVTSNGSDITIYGKIRSSWDYVTTDQASGVDDSDDNTGVFRTSWLGFKGTEALTSTAALKFRYHLG
ncbi:MAG: hypothetical protein BECKG1743E_GA0114224_102072 [Candidatus Kentron sp. G]|nr:MAG: hypothetical protein BECKG1743E_GA0114224_102072 [Candidatus Kentron sp. G]